MNGDELRAYSLSTNLGHKHPPTMIKSERIPVNSKQTGCDTNTLRVRRRKNASVAGEIGKCNFGGTVLKEES